MLLLNSKKMSKSDGNTISPEELFTGESPHVTKGYDPMVVRFFMLQSHYRSTMDMTDDGLQAAEKGYFRLMDGLKTLESLQSTVEVSNDALDLEVRTLMQSAHEDLLDDFNAPKALATLFELVTIINALKGGQRSLDAISHDTLGQLKSLFNDFIFDLFGLKDIRAEGGNLETLEGLMELILELRANARTQKDWGTSDKIRDALQALKIQVKDSKEGTSWSL
jgi:cysteinyl-tRNA synthetase